MLRAGASPSWCTARLPSLLKVSATLAGSRAKPNPARASAAALLMYATSHAGSRNSPMRCSVSSAMLRRLVSRVVAM